MEQLSLIEAPPLPFATDETVTPKSGRPLRLKYYLVRTREALQYMVEANCAAEAIAHDTETSGLVTALGARAIGHAFACQTGPGEISLWYAPIRHHNAVGMLPIDEVNAAVGKILASPGRCFWAHGKFDWHMLAADGITTNRSAIDVLVLANIANENEPSFQLKALADKYCLPGARAEEDALDDWMRKDARVVGLRYRQRARGDIEEVDALGEPTYLERYGYARTPVELCGRYACRDVFYNLYLGLVHYARVPQLYPELFRREHESAQCLFDMEAGGLPVDVAKIREVHDRTGKQITHWLAELRKITGDPEFIPTDDAIRDVLYVKLGLVPQKWTDGGKTKKKKPSVDREARELLKRKYPEHVLLLQALTKIADAAKYHGTYSGNFLRYVAPDTNRIHPSYNQLEKREKGVPVTGRLSSSNPNVQNIAQKALALDDDEDEVNVREYFLVPPGYIRAYIDFSQIELRVLAWFCQDPNLLRAYREGLDIHQVTADLLGISRRVAKQVNFGNSYGMTEMGLALRMPGYFDDPKATREEAKRVLEAFFARYPAIKTFEASLAAEMRRNNNSFVNPFGRPRRIEWISAYERWKRQRAQRQMMSSIISGTAADLMKECMINGRRILKAESPESRLAQSVHDELVFDLYAAGPWQKSLASIVTMMEHQPMFSAAGPHGFGQGVPIEVSVELTTTDWKDKKAVKVHPNGELQWLSAA